MSPQKIIVTILLIVIVISGIVYLNSQKTERSSFDEGVDVTPRIKNDTDSETDKNILPTDNPNAEDKSKTAEEKSSVDKSKKYPLAKEITTPDGFINTNGLPVTIGEFVGKKVVLIDFWTYSCINCQRTTPYLNAWYEKYKDKGLVIIGIHTPEFEFEKIYENVLQATIKEKIKYPVVLDNDYSTWTAYKNRYWPRKYLIDIDGYVVYDIIGEGAYEETEKKIQEALAERMAVLGETGIIDQSITKEIPLEGGPRSPETYFGSARNQYFGNGSQGISGTQKGLTLPTQLALNTLYLYGDWNLTPEFAENISSDAGIIYRYNSKDVFLVAESSEDIVVEVLLDGNPLTTQAGSDIIKTDDGKTTLKINEARLYKIIQDTQSGTHTLEFKIPNSGLKAFAFTFG